MEVETTIFFSNEAINKYVIQHCEEVRTLTDEYVCAAPTPTTFSAATDTTVIA